MRPLLNLLSPAGVNARLSTLIFHRVLDVPDPVFPEEVDAARFDGLCRWVRHWFNVLPLDEAVTRLRAGTLPARAMAITFDDGYADNHRVALPILQRHGLNATFFVSTRFLDGGSMWNDIVVEALRSAAGREIDLGGVGPAGLGFHPIDTSSERRMAIEHVINRIKYLAPGDRQEAAEAVAAAASVTTPPHLMMRSAQVHELARQGMGVGGHTATHPILAGLDSAEARREIELGKTQLEAIVDRPVHLFAYPNGKPYEDYTAATVALVREAGFTAAVCTAWGVARRGTDPYQIPRFTPWDSSPLRFGARLLQNLCRTPALI